ncbi:hypothetical protein [Marinomonas posidonica]|uniref:Uncharacterized protein n=1 Tax=Marinomonas posidonica (strain CECT 7376 / NCIMB 14433 / IVIA-Po-181) TaxID=491952 RepID=F6CVE3_MARPP|nr:hypothetical protein [Marinomonas posidonica]AEF54253.1 hypothetical protein Mar181_1206 [Marinomonas posidonica IVIA-Po-181]
MKPVFCLLCVFSSAVLAQTIERQPVEIIYGNQVIRAEHQVVLSSKDEVSIIPVDKAPEERKPNVVVSANASTSSYLEENAISQREQEIYDEVNQRTKDAPFTVLFTGNVPEEIENRRLRMMPEIGLLNERGDAISDQDVKPDIGDFSPIGQDVAPIPSGSAGESLQSKQKKLEALIGG